MTTWDGLDQPTGKYRSIRHMHMEYPKFQTRIFCSNGKRPMTREECLLKRIGLAQDNRRVTPFSLPNLRICLLAERSLGTGIGNGLKVFERRPRCEVLSDEFPLGRMTFPQFYLTVLTLLNTQTAIYRWLICSPLGNKSLS